MDQDEKKHLLNLIDWLYQGVINSGGDGDAMWYSKVYNVNDILPLIQEYNGNLRYKWDIRFDKDNNTIEWGEDQEWIIITNSKEKYESAPSWQQCIIIF